MRTPTHKPTLAHTQSLFDAQQGTAGPVSQTGELYQAMEVHCGAIKPTATCTALRPSQISRANGRGAGELSTPTTYCDDDTFIRSESLYQSLIGSDPLFSTMGLVSVLCTRNLNRTEIYNVTGYNYTCLPPCTPTLFTYQIRAPGCTNNCSLTQRGIKGYPCLNTYGLYPDEYVCNGGEFHGQACIGFSDILTCSTLSGGIGFCTSRDAMDGVAGFGKPDLKNSPKINRNDPSVIVHAVQHGDIYFVDWLHRAAMVKWNEVSRVIHILASLHTLHQDLHRHIRRYEYTYVTNAKVHENSTEQPRSRHSTQHRVSMSLTSKQSVPE